MNTKEAAGRRPPTKETLRSNIKNYIQQQIAEGVYRPGDRIVETRLARELNVSQAPVREAILELSAIGLLEERPYSGTYVRNLTVDEIRDIFDIRAFLEEYAVRRAAKLAGEEQFFQMERILQEMDQNRELGAFARLDMDFHEQIMDAAGSPSLKRAWQILRVAEWTYLSTMVTESSLEELIDQHHRIMRYLRDRDEDSAGAYMLLHIKRFGNEVAHYFEQRQRTGKAEDAPYAAQNRE